MLLQWTMKICRFKLQNKVVVCDFLVVFSSLYYNITMKFSVLETKPNCYYSGD